MAKARKRCADPLVLVKQRIDYSHYVGLRAASAPGLRHCFRRASPYHRLQARTWSSDIGGEEQPAFLLCIRRPQPV